MLKLGFLRSGTLYPIFVECFFYATSLKICFTEASPQFLPETKRFARVKDSSRFSALCDLPETKNIFENAEDSVFNKNYTEMISMKMNGFILRNERDLGLELLRQRTVFLRIQAAACNFFP